MPTTPPAMKANAARWKNWRGSFIRKGLMYQEGRFHVDAEREIKAWKAMTAKSMSGTAPSTTAQARQLTFDLATVSGEVISMPDNPPRATTPTLTQSHFFAPLISSNNDAGECRAAQGARKQTEMLSARPLEQPSKADGQSYLISTLWSYWESLVIPATNLSHCAIGASNVYDPKY